MKKLSKAFKLLKSYGFRALSFRIKYAIISKSGLLKRKFPVFDWTERPLRYWLAEEYDLDEFSYLQWRKENSPAFFFEPEHITSLKLPDSKATISKADDIISGKFEFFFKDNF